MAVNGNIFTMEDSNAVTFRTLCNQLAGLLQSASSDFENLCQSSMIKRFSRYKPEDYNTPLHLTEAQRAENHYGFSKEALYFKAGFSTEPHAVYEYIKPKGGASSPNRMRDWDGYYHGAVSPLFLDFPRDLYVDYVNGVAIIANSTGKTGYDPTKCVKLGEIIKAPSNMYVALYIFYDGSNQWLLPSSVKVNDLSESTFPTFMFANNQDNLNGNVASGNVCTYIIPEIADYEDEELVLIAVGVENLTYQTDQIPLSIGGSGSKAIGDRMLFSMEIEKGEDRKTILPIMRKKLNGLNGVFTANLGTATKRSIINGRQTYVLNNVTSKLTLTTPSEWYFTEKDKVNINVTIKNNFGAIYQLNGTQVTSNQIVQSNPTTIVGANKTIELTDLLAPIYSYQFDDWSGGSSNQLAFLISITASKSDGSGTITLLHPTVYYVSKP